LESITGGWVEKEVHVIAAAEHVFLNCKLLLKIDIPSEIPIIPSDKIALSPFCSSIFDDYRTVDIMRVVDNLG
jgi:hypothetical protein